MNTKAEVRQQLLGNMIMGRCEQESGLIFRPSHCSGTKCLRFTTGITEELLSPEKTKTGAWNTGILLQYEIYNGGTSLHFQLSLSLTGLSRSQKAKMEALLLSAESDGRPNKEGIITVRCWDYPIGTDVQNAQQALDEIFEIELPFFETELCLWQKDHRHGLRPFPEVDEDLTEGNAMIAQSTRFERNREARKRCIAHYGAFCQICGFDFGKVYGPAFTGKIEVHHIVPLNEIRDNYTVDPIHDLIPVCSNCHTAMHSRKNGVYAPDELKNLLRR